MKLLAPSICLCLSRFGWLMRPDPRRLSMFHAFALYICLCKCRQIVCSGWDVLNHCQEVSALKMSCRRGGGGGAPPLIAVYWAPWPMIVFGELVELLLTRVRS